MSRLLTFVAAAALSLSVGAGAVCARAPVASTKGRTNSSGAAKRVIKGRKKAIAQKQ